MMVTTGKPSATSDTHRTDIEEQRVLREVPGIGGYTQEFFVSQTPELAAMADVIIDLETFRCAQRKQVCLSM